MKKRRMIVLAATVILAAAAITCYFLFLYVPNYPRVEAHITGKLVNQNSSPEAVALYDYLKSIYGKQIISGQMTYAFQDKPGGYEDDVIQQQTGKLPYLNGFDLSWFVWAGDAGPIDAAIAWHNQKGGLVTFTWHWLLPTKEGNTTFQAGNAKYGIKKALQSGTAENDKLMADLKKAADGLEKLKNAGVPVLFRPLHEADLGYFWWSGAGPEPCRKLWSIMYDYFVNQRGLNNLIWVWSGQSKAWLVPENEFDIVGMDIYPRSKINRSSQVNLFNKAQGMAPTKMVALSECEFIPEPQNLIKDQAYWLWYMPWQTTYLYVADEKDPYSPVPVQPYQLNPKYIDKETLNRIMSDQYVITLGEAK